MKPIEFLSSESMDSVYMRCPYHPYFQDIVNKAGGKFIDRNEDWIYTYKLPIMSFLSIYKDLAEGSPVELDPFLEATLGDSIKLQPYKFDLPLVKPIGFLEGITPMGYQLEALSHAWNYKKSIIGLPVGAGKSWTGKGFKELAGIPFLLVVPASIKHQWKLEIKKMTGRDALVIDGTPKKREKLYAIADKYEWVILNYETLVNDYDKIPKFKGIIIDEAHYLKNPDSKRTKAIKKYVADMEYVLLLTGTFLVNSLMDGWSLLDLLGQADEKNFYAFKKKNCVVDRYDKPVAFKPSIANFKKKLKKLTYYRQKEEIMPDLPERRDIIVPIQLNPDESKLYENIEQGILLDLDDPTKGSILDPQAAYTRLRQAAANPMIIFEEGEYDKKIKSSKIEWIDNFLESYDERTIIIYSPFNKFLESLKQELPQYPWVHIHGGVDSKKREELIEGARNSKEKSYFLITDAVKTGKNIQFCQNFVFTSLPLTWADYDQLRGRIWRKGQEHSTNIWMLFSEGTIDDKNWDLINSKKDLMNDFTIKSSPVSKDDLRRAINKNN